MDADAGELAREQLARIVDTTRNLVVLTDLDGKATWVNEAFRRRTGYTDADILGRSPGDVLQGRDSEPATVARMAAAIRERRPFHEEIVNYARDGERYWIQIDCEPLRDADGTVTGFMAIQQDITARKVAEAAAAHRERELRAVLEGARDHLIARLDAAGTITGWHGGAEELTGWVSAAIVGQPLAVLFPDDAGADGATALLAGARRAGIARIHAPCRRREAPPFVARGTLTLAVPGEPSHGLVLLLSDASREAELEQQLRRAQKLEALGRLAGGVAHDFNNLLQVITSFGEHVRDGIPPGHPLRDATESVLDAAARAGSLVRQLLLFGRPSSETLAVVDAAAAVRSLLPLLERVIGEDIALRLTLPREAMPVRCDPSQLEQVVMNLVINARDAMPDGGGLAVSVTRVILDEEQAAAHEVPAGSFVELRVRDTGAGMTPETLAHIFEPFFTTKGELGTGLGLATVYGVARHAGGYVCVQSAPGRGATFRVAFPEAIACDDEAPSAAAPARDVASPTGAYRVLLVEDDAQVRQVMETVLSRAGFAVTAVGSAEDAATLWRASPEAFDVVVTDVVLPGTSGPQFLAQRLAERPALAGVLVSGYPDDVLARHHAALDGRRVLRKPFTPTALVAAVHDALAEVS
jgi:PAS domain S-box-containing protein